MKAVAPGLGLSVALLLATSCNASDSVPSLSMGLGQVLAHLDQDQSRMLTRQSDAIGRRFSSVGADQVMQTLAHSGAITLVLLGTRGRGDNAALSIERVLRITGSSGPAAAASLDPAYRVGQAELADLGIPMAKLAAEGHLDAHSNMIGVESCSARRANEALNTWKGVRYVATLESASASSPPVLKQLLLIPDSIRISIDGNAPASTPASTAAMNAPAMMAAPASIAASALPSNLPAGAPPPPLPTSQDFEQRQQEQQARADDERKRMDAQVVEQAQKEKEEEPERERKQAELDEQERQAAQQ